MTPYKYHIGTGFHSPPSDHPSSEFEKSEFFRTWMRNTLRYSFPKRITIMSDSGSVLPYESDLILNLNLSGNLGHFMELLSGAKPYKINGWSGVIVTLALIAYCDECDFIFKEQDALAFGPWVEAMYEQLGAAGAIWGNCSFMPCEQSLFLVKHGHIPDFVAHYLDGPPQNRDGEFGEHKFKRMEEKYPEKYKRFSFGSGRDRPIPWDDPVFYFQQAKSEDVTEAIRRGLA
jgi:hypothetical protein